MSKTSLPFNDVISHEVLRQAQAPLRAIAEALHVREVCGQYDFRPVLQDKSEKITTESVILRLGEDDIVIVISPLISQDHFNPYQMGIFASSEIQAVGLRAELRTWIDYANEDLPILGGYKFNNGQQLVNWYKSLLAADPLKADHVAKVAHMAGLVTRYCHPHAHVEVRNDILQELKDLGNRGVNDANRVLELLTSPSTEIIKDNELQKHRQFVDSPITSLCFQLVEESYELEIKRLINKGTVDADSRYPITRLIQETRLTKKPVKIVFAGNFEDIHSIYCLYTLLKYQVTILRIPDVQVDTGIADTIFYIVKEERYVTLLKRWFNKARQSIPNLTHLIRSAVSNDFNNFQIKNNVRCLAPTEEELVLFYLRMLSPLWNNAFINIIEKNDKALKYYIKMKNKMGNLIPKDWKSAIDAYWHFSDFIKREHPKYYEIVYTLQPINLITDNQITQATVIVTASQKSITKLIRRFPEGVAKKAMFFSDIASKISAFSSATIQSPYTPPKFLSNAKWDPIKEKSIKDILLKYIVPALKQEVSIHKIKAIKLVEQKRASRKAIESVKQYIVHLQKLSMNGNDEALIHGFIFLLAVMSDINPYSDEWKFLLNRYRESREDLQDAIFEGKTRALSDLIAVKFLRHYVGPKEYANRNFPDVYQQCNDQILNLLIRNLEIRSTSTNP